MTANDIRKEFKHLGEPELAIAYGRLVDVDTEMGCATLDVYPNERIPLRFDASMKDETLKLNRKSVGVRGHGWINEDDTEWVAIVIEELIYPTAKPFDWDDFMNNPNPKIFDPDNVVRLSEPFDADEFDELLYRLRHTGER